MTYRHRDHEVRLALLEAAHLGDQKRSEVGDEGLNDKDKRDHSKVSQFLSGQL